MEKFLPKKVEKEVISMRISSDILSELDTKAATFDISRNELINQCIAFALENMDDIYNNLEKRSTEELDYILNYATAQENYPEYEKVIKAILSIIAEREKDIKPEITPEIRAAWEKFLKDVKEPVNM